MNPPIEEHLPPPPQPPQSNRNSTSCDRHPDEHFNGFCPSCLCERLTVLDQSISSISVSTSAARKSTSSALKSIFKSDNKPAFRRTKSFSGGKNDGFSSLFEPQRKSCDVRVRNTIWSLFSQDMKRPIGGVPGSNQHSQIFDANNSESSVVLDISQKCELQFGTAAAVSSSACVAAATVIESNEEDEGVETERVYEDAEDQDQTEVEASRSGEIQEVEEEEAIVGCNYTNLKLSSSSAEQQQQQVVSEALEEEEKFDLMPMKDHIDLDSSYKKAGGKDLKEIAGNFWSAASVFRKKVKAWTTKKNNRPQHKMKKRDGIPRGLKPNKKDNAARPCRETQSEVADYGFGRRSSDTDPRFSLDVGRMSWDAARISLEAGRASVDAGRMSLDAGRMSCDDSRYSFDEPRASWDGHIIGRSFPRMPPMVSVVEDAPVSVSTKDTQIPVEEPARNSVTSINEDDGTSSNNDVPGGAAQTKDYYSDSSSRRRKSLDRSSSISKTGAAELDDMKAVVSNFKVSPASNTAAADYLRGEPEVPVPGGGSGDADREVTWDSKCNSLRGDCSERFDAGFGDNASAIGVNGGYQKGTSKKSRRWRAWNVWGLIVRRVGSNKYEEEEDSYSRVNVVERSYSESWKDLRAGDGDSSRSNNDPIPRVGFSRYMFRSNSSVSRRNTIGSFGHSYGITKGDGSTLDTNVDGGHGKTKKTGEFVLKRNRSARYSPNHVDSGLLRFYMTPLRGSRKGSGGGGAAKAKPAYSHSIARNLLRLY